MGIRRHKQSRLGARLIFAEEQEADIIYNEKIAMNNLPSNMRRHTVFRDNPYSHTVVFPNDYPLPAANLIKMQVRQDRRILTGIEAEISVTDKRVTFTYSPATLSKLPEITQQYMVLDGVSVLGGELGAKIGYGDQDISETHVTVTDGEVTVVQVMGLELVTEQVSIATDAAAEATQGATTATEQASIATSGAGTATTKAGEAEVSAGVADGAKTDAEAAKMAAESAQSAAEDARDEAIQVVARKVDRWEVDTKAEADAFVLTLTTAAVIDVVDDESNGGGRASYYWNTVELQEYLLL